jgi:Bacterial PH domain
MNEVIPCRGHGLCSHLFHTVFTNMRVLVIDTKGLSGQKKEVTSIPYSSIREFSTTSAGDWDRDSEVSISTRNAWSLGTTSLDFRKGKSDIVTIQKFLAAMVMENHEDAKEFLKSKSGSAIQIANPVSLKSFNAWLTANSVEMDAGDVDQKLHSEPPVLLSDEKCLKAYRSGRDLYVYTNYRRLHVDVQGIQGKRVRYGSVPWKHVKALEIETAGNFDRDAEVYIHTEITRKSQDILVKRGDIYEAHSILSELLIFGGQKK